VFDLGHIKRGYRSAQYFTEETEQALARGGGMFDDPAISRGGFFRGDYEANYSVSGKISPDQIEAVSYGMYTNFELGYEEHQAGRVDFYSAFSPEDFPSDHLGFWAYINDRDLNEIPGILESLGKVTPWQGGSLQMDTVTIDTPTGIQVIILGFPRNHEFTPMAPLTIDNGGGVIETRWRNVPWPAWLELTPLPSGSDTWQRVY
jgi:hypothetical protein